MALTTGCFNGQADKRPLSAGFADIQNNAFFKIVFDTTLSLDAKKTAATDYLGSHSIAERPLAMREIQTLHLFLQSERARMSQQRVRLTSSGDEGGSIIAGIKDFNRSMYGVYAVLDAACKAGGDALFERQPIRKDIGNIYSDLERTYGAMPVATETAATAVKRSAPFQFRKPG